MDYSKEFKLDASVQDDWEIIEERIKNYLCLHSDPTIANNYKAMKQFRYTLMNGSRFTTEELQRLVALASIEKFLNEKIKESLEIIHNVDVRYK